jgi:hypothetical protein
MYIIIIIATILFLLYIQFAPDMGNIWIRCGKFAPINAVNMIIHPLYNIYMWTVPQMWLINYWIWIFVVVSLYYGITWLSSNSTYSYIIATIGS